MFDNDPETLFLKIKEDVLLNELNFVLDSIRKIIVQIFEYVNLFNTDKKENTHFLFIF